MLSTCGDWISTTPRTPQPAAAHTVHDGRTCSSGQLSSATQMGKVLVSVSTSAVRSWARAKKVQSRLRLPAQLRSHSTRGRQNTSSAPDSRASARAKAQASELLARATTRQSQASLRAWASSLIHANEKQPHSIHRYGASGRLLTAGAWRLHGPGVFVPLS